MYDTYGAQLWSVYGFKDAFNLTVNWWDTDYIGIDQGPIIIMIENWRTGSVWSRFMQDEDIQRGLAAAGFIAVTGIDDPVVAREPSLLFQNVPNPFRSSTMISYSLSAPGPVSLMLFDVAGRPVRTLVDDIQSAGPHQILLQGEGLPSGVYYYWLRTDENRLGKRCILLR
jgi:hypothetical protein